MDIIAQFFACFSQKLAPARKNSTDWSARSARFCNSAVNRALIEGISSSVEAKNEYEFELVGIFQALDVGWMLRRAAQVNKYWTFTVYFLPS